MKKFIATLLFLFLLSFPLSADIHNAASGSYDDIQTAVDAASDDDIVAIPTGTHDFGDGFVTITDKLIHIRGTGRSTTIIQKTGTEVADMTMFVVSMPNKTGGPYFSDMTLIDTNGPYGEYSANTRTTGINLADGCWDFKVYNMEIEGFGSAGIQLSEYEGVEEYEWKQRGVIYNCRFLNNNMPGLGYGVVIYGANDASWDETIELGAAYAVFVEDCYFENHRHHIASNWGARYVFRYNTCIKNTAPAIDTHGLDLDDESLRGTVSFEVYENVVEQSLEGSPKAFSPGGGTGVVYDNTFKDMYWGCYLRVGDCQSGSSHYPCDYPVGDQINDLYIWGNTYVNCTLEVAVGSSYTDLIQEDRDYFLEEKSGYTAYTYPHPSRLGHPAIYYVDKTTGSDSDTGLTEALAWETVNKVNTSVFNPDDGIKFKRGEEWLETLTIPSAGLADTPITFRAYGSGVAPIINGADLIAPGTSWATSALYVEIWNAEDQSGDTGWAVTASGGATDKNMRIIIDNGSISAGATTIRLKLYADADQNNTLTQCSVGPKKAAGDAFDFDDTPTNVQFDSGNEGVTLTAGSTKYSDNITFTINASNDYLVAFYVTGNRFGRLDGTATNQYIKSGLGSSEADTADVAGYAAHDDIYTVAAIDSYLTPANVWMATCTTEPNQVFFDGTRGNKQTAIGDVDSENDWYWVGSVLHVYSTTDPDTAYTDPGIEPSQRDFCIDTNGKDYVVIAQLKLIKANVANVLLDGTNQTDLNYCLILDGVDGVEMDTTGSMVQNCVIYGCVNGVDVDAAGYIKNSIIRSCTDDLEETGANINKVTNNIEDDADSDPLFTDAAGYDFTLQSSSPCIDAGTDVGLGEDHSGNTVAALITTIDLTPIIEPMLDTILKPLFILGYLIPEIGAYEYLY